LHLRETALAERFPAAVTSLWVRLPDGDPISADIDAKYHSQLDHRIVRDESMRGSRFPVNESHFSSFLRIRRWHLYQPRGANRKWLMSLKSDE
jgi:hypothetical protein